MRPNSKKTPIFIDSKPASKNREGRRMTYTITWGGVGGTRGRIHETSCSVVISARRINIVRQRWQLGARCSLDRCDNSRAAGVRLGRSFRPIRFGLLILLPQVLPRIKTQTDFV